MMLDEIVEDEWPCHASYRSTRVRNAHRQAFVLWVPGLCHLWCSQEINRLANAHWYAGEEDRPVLAGIIFIGACESQSYDTASQEDTSSDIQHPMIASIEQSAPGQC